MEEPSNLSPQDNASRSSMLKGMSVFGGVQVFQIGINLIRGKFVAMILGPVGMGVSSLFFTAGQTLQQIASLGMNTAIVKEVAGSRDDTSALQHLLVVVKRLLLVTSLMGALVCALFAAPLSKLTFGSDAYTFPFVLLSLMVFFTIAGNGLLSVLQGLHAVKYISMTTIAGCVAGLLIGIPLYLIWGMDGIVPALIVFAITTFVAAYIGFRKTAPLNAGRFVWSHHKPVVKKLIALGLLLASAGAVTAACNYIINLVIRAWGDIAHVGLFQAANSLTNQYAAVVFTAMMLDYFPRLAAVANDNVRVRSLVNSQLEIVSLMTAPLLCLLLLFAPLAVQLLLSPEFESIVPLIRWLAFGVLIKAFMYPLGYISFAKDNKKLFFLLEGLFGNLLTLTLNVIFYLSFGLDGLGYALVVDCAICLMVYYAVNARVYGYSLNSAAMKEMAIALLLVSGCFVPTLFPISQIAYLIMGIFTFSAVWRSTIRLKKILHSRS